MTLSSQAVLSLAGDESIKDMSPCDGVDVRKCAKT